MQGVKQGGILSPFLYTLYVNDFFSELNISVLGACVGDVFVGSPMYADDLALVAATASDLQVMFKVVHIVTPVSGSTSLMPANLRYLSLDAESPRLLTGRLVAMLLRQYSTIPISVF